jgi:GNAT superfamily N-acetyltransferase
MMPEETGPELMIRLYLPADRAALLQIGADTAFFGEPIEFYMEDRRIFLDTFYAYYTDYEPEHTWVACAGQQVVGFLTGCTDTRRQQRTLLYKLIPGVAWRLLRGHPLNPRTARVNCEGYPLNCEGYPLNCEGYYHLGKKARRYVRAIISAGLRREFPRADLKQYPAHLHINLAAEWRGYGLGQRLMQAYLAQLKQLGVRGVHLGTTSINEIACHMYERTGFHLLGAHPTRMWAGLIDYPVENRCYGMEF